MTKHALSIITPTLNEAKNVEILAKRIKNAVKDINYEVIIVDDNSPDKTYDIAKKLDKKYNIRAFKRIKNKGLSSAVVFGFAKARGEIICVIDADLSHPPELIPRMFNKIRNENVDLVVASRLIKGGNVEDWPIHRKLLSQFGILLSLPLSSVNDRMSGFFMMRKKVIRDVKFVPRGYKILLEVLVKGDYDSVKEIPYTFRNRKVGTSKLTIKTNIEYLVQLLQLYRVKFLR